LSCALKVGSGWNVDCKPVPNRSVPREDYIANVAIATRNF
jgi:hypothetical protein